MSAEKKKEWWETPGYSPGLTSALRAFHRARRGAPTDADGPPVSVLPMTPAAKVARRLSREGLKAPRGHRRVAT